MNCFRAGTWDKDIKLKQRTVRKHSLVKKKNYMYIYIQESFYHNKKNLIKIFRNDLHIIPEVSRRNLAIRAMKKSIFIFLPLLLCFVILAYVSSQG